MNSPLLRRVRTAVGVLAVTFMVVAFVRTWDERQWLDTVDLTPFSIIRLAIAFLLSLVVLPAAARSWSCLFPTTDQRDLRHAFYRAQLGKYIPGAIWQPIGQVGLAHIAGVPLSLAATAYPVHTLTQLTAGAILGSLIGLATDFLALPWRLVASLAILTPLVLLRPFLVTLLSFLLRHTKRTFDPLIVPSQEAILRAFFYNIITIVAAGASFWVLLEAFYTNGSDPWMISGFALAWTVGFLAFPFPAGVGVRESVLAALFAATVSPALIVTVSIAHRLLSMSSEALMILLIASRSWYSRLLDTT